MTAACPHFDRCLALARAGGMDDLVGLAYLNLGSSYGEHYQFAKAEAILTEGIAYAEDCDLDHSNNYMSAWLALTRLYQGRWGEAGDHATAVIECPNFSLVSQIMALVALWAVCGSGAAIRALAAVLDEALDLALQTNTLQRLAPVRAARAEAAWFAGDTNASSKKRLPPTTLAPSHRHRWHVGEFSFWLKRAGEEVTLARILRRTLRSCRSAATGAPPPRPGRHLDCPYRTGPRACRWR